MATPKYEVLYPFQADGKRFTAENAAEVSELPDPIREHYRKAGNIREAAATAPAKSTTKPRPAGEE